MPSRFSGTSNLVAGSSGAGPPFELPATMESMRTRAPVVQERGGSHQGSFVHTRAHVNSAAPTAIMTLGHVPTQDGIGEGDGSPSLELGAEAVENAVAELDKRWNFHRDALVAGDGGGYQFEGSLHVPGPRRVAGPESHHAPLREVGTLLDRDANIADSLGGKFADEGPVGKGGAHVDAGDEVEVPGRDCRGHWNPEGVMQQVREPVAVAT